MNPNELLSHFNIKCNLLTPISDLKISSKAINKNDVFIAIKGVNHSSLEFIDDAFSHGAQLVLTNEYIERENVIYIKDLEKIKGDLAYTFYGNCSTKLKMIGITGTNGKTSIAQLLYQALTALSYKVMVIGTIGAKCGDFYEELENTTPDIVTLARLYHLAYQMGCEYVVMEVSSHAISLNRIDKVKYDICIFTNISNEHLDYHKTFIDYLNVKARLFSNIKDDGYALINIDDENSNFIIQHCTKGKVLTFGKKSFQYQLTDIVESDKGLEFKINNHNFKTSLLGSFNAYNLSPIYIILKLLKVEDSKVAETFMLLTPIPGRMERLNINNYNIIIDFAHTPDAMEKVIKYVNNFKKGRLLCLFGCGGNRDKTKRPLMGKIATQLCDFAIISDDNPRYENSSSIIQDIVKGITKTNYVIISDRKQAIKEAVRMLNPNDTLLILGKGHESYQIIQDKKIFFSDKEEALYECQLINLY
jgi:UDP-N-acetylmuramoyl-L-alanyl-D-glutamate--2,6-diaminopimelate ligase